MLQDIVDGHPVGAFHHLFVIFEQLAGRLAPLCASARVARMTCIRVGNEMLRRIGKQVSDSALAGRVILFLSYILPLADSAGLTVAAPTVGALLPDSAPEIVPDEPPVTVDVNFYRSFWSLQSAFYNPTSVTKPDGWAAFVKSAESVLNLLSAVSAVPAPPTPLVNPPELDGDAHAYFVKFLSNGRLFKLQLRDPQFRRQLLSELLAFLHTISFTPARPALPPAPKQKVATPFLPPPSSFKEKQKVISDLQNQARVILERTTPGGHAFATSLLQALIREANWVSLFFR